MKNLKIIIALVLLAAMLVGCAKAPVAPPAAPEAPAAPVEAAPEAAPEAPAEAPAPEAAADDDWAYISGKGTIVIGITEFEPMNYYDESGKLIGFDTEFAEAACSKLGVTPEFIVIDWDSKELELSSKNIDCIWNGLTVTEERKANMGFTKSYLGNRQAVVVQADKAADYADLAAFAGKKVVAEEGSAGATAVADTMPEASLINVGAQADALLEVMSGTADAAVIDLTMADAMVGEGTDYASLIKLDIDMADEEYAIGFRVGSSAVEKFNETIAGLFADGTMAAIAEKYKQSDLLIAG